MPCFRGIDISFTAEPQTERIPEFPHPDGSSVRLLGLQVANSPQGFDNAGTDPAPLQKINPKVSVYIPSQPGSRFWLNYNVTDIALPASSTIKYIFFKLYINGRPITSWGIDPKISPDGRVVRTLWAPTERWADPGIEGRNLVFLPSQEAKSVLDDGGLIEVVVFRASDRRARAPKLDQFRGQEKYGIASPSMGLLDKPQEASYFEWFLIDPRHMPYATFRFYYRTWHSLQQLQLVPPTEYRITSSNSTISIGGRSNLSNATAEADCGFEFGLNSLDEDVFEDENSPIRDTTEDTNVACAPTYSLKPPPELLPVSAYNDFLPQPSKVIRDCFPEGYLQRPLPELPVDNSSLSRKSSTSSKAPSIAPSLMQYVDDDSFDHEHFDFGAARAVTLMEVSPRLSLIEHGASSPAAEPSQANSTEVSFSDYDSDSKVSEQADSPLLEPEYLLSPGNYIAMSGSALDRELELFGTPRKQPSPLHLLSSDGTTTRIVSPKAKQILGDEVELGGEFASPNLGTLTLTEGEWMRRTPSPVRKTAGENTLIARLRSPRPNRRSGASGAAVWLLSNFRRARSRSSSPKKEEGLDMEPELAVRYKENDALWPDGIQGSDGNWI